MTRLSVCEGAGLVKQLVTLQKVRLVQHRSSEPFVVVVQAPHDTCGWDANAHALSLALRFAGDTQRGACFKLHC